MRRFQAGRRRRARRVTAAIVAVLTLAGSSASLAAAAPLRSDATGDASTIALTAPLPRSGCRAGSGYLALANGLLANRYTLNPHKTVILPSNPSWRENPLGDNNWRFQYHSLRFLWNLTTAWTQTGDARYINRALTLARDWYVDNPRSAPRSPYSWNDHATAWRAMVYACLAEIVPMSTWLRDALALHGRTLADPNFYVRVGNHALNQAIGLLEVGCILRRSDWKTLAASRISTLVSASVDSQGMANEQSVDYELYNWVRYTAAKDRLVACGQTVPAGMTRIDRMPSVLAQMTLPNGRYEMLGDTADSPARAIVGTVAEFAATLGASGPKPTATVTRYGAGYVFARSGWGETSPYPDERMMTFQFGPGRAYHGHADGGSVTLYGYGSRLLVDPGKYTYNGGSWRSYFTGRSAHNVVTVDGVAFSPGARTSLQLAQTSATMVDTKVALAGYAGVTGSRRVLFSRRLNYLVVEDRASAGTVSRRFRQLWHLREGSAPYVGSSIVWTRRARGNVALLQLGVRPSVRVISGATSPIQGWLSYSYGRKVAAPVVEYSATGRSVRFLTLIVPYASLRSINVSGLSMTRTGFSLTVTMDGRAERVVVSGTSASITPL